MAKLEIFYNGKVVRELIPSTDVDETILANIYEHAIDTYYILQKLIAASALLVEKLCDDSTETKEIDEDDIFNLFETIRNANALSDLIDPLEDDNEK